MSSHLLNQSVKIGSLTLNNRVFLAPLAGVSDVPMRRLCQEYGAGLTYVEMLSATAINYQNRKTFEMMARHPSEGVLGVQVTGPSGEEVGQAVESLVLQGFETIDINMGCPVKKVVQAGCGSGLLKDREKTKEVLEAARSATTVPLSVKTRLGFTREELTAPYVCSLGDQLGYQMVTLHGRTRSEGYNTPVDAQTLSDCFQRFTGSKSSDVDRTSPLAVGNGDVFGVQGAHYLLEVGGAHAVMVSRGALGNPWIFKGLLDGKDYYPTITEWSDVVLRHLDWHKDHYGSRPGAAALFRKHLIWYAKGFPGVKAIRERVGELDSLESIKELVVSFAQKCDPGVVRFNGVKDVFMAHQGVGKGQAMGSPDSGFDPKWDMHRELDKGVGDACL